MNRNEFNRFIAGDALPGPGDIEGLRELTVLFPWFHSAHMLLLRGLKENADIRFDAQLKASALSVSDREMLYHYLFMQPVVETAKEETPWEGTPQVEATQEEATREASPQEVSLQPEATQEIPVTPEEVMEVAPVAEVQEEIVQEEAAPVVEVQEEIVQEDAAPVVEVKDEIVQEEVTQTQVEVAPAEATQAEITPAEVIPEQTVAETVPAVETEAAVTEGPTWRTREELLAEIEARLEEISSRLEEVPETDAGTEEPSSHHEEVPETETAVAQDAEVPVAEVQPEPEPSGEELLELLTDNESPAPEPAKQLTQQDLIDRFIKNSPNLERIPLVENQPVKDLSEQVTEEHGKFITETLAKIYINQGYYTKAINIYEKLSLQFPEKSAYFAGRIEKIKDLIK